MFTIENQSRAQHQRECMHKIGRARNSIVCVFGRLTRAVPDHQGSIDLSVECTACRVRPASVVYSRWHLQTSSGKCPPVAVTFMIISICLGIVASERCAIPGCRLVACRSSAKRYSLSSRQFGDVVVAGMRDQPKLDSNHFIWGHHVLSSGCWLLAICLRVTTPDYENVQTHSN